VLLCYVVLNCHCAECRSSECHGAVQDFRVQSPDIIQMQVVKKKKRKNIFKTCLMKHMHALVN
jgi:hypothetical protein